VETERIGAGPKIHVAIRDTSIKQRTRVALNVKHTADAEPACLDAPRAARRIRQLADRQAGLWLYQGKLQVLAANAYNVPG
jgi:hypothetical protein